jgi:hypothetical protein
LVDRLLGRREHRVLELFGMWAGGG